MAVHPLAEALDARAVHTLCNRARISWCPTGVTPSRAQVPSESPLRRHRRGRVLPQTEACFGPALPHAGHVPSSWFLTTPTAFAFRGCEGLLHPPADREVHRVAVTWTACLRCRVAFPRCQTLQSVSLRSQPPRPSPGGRAPLPLLHQELDFEALIREGVRCDAMALPPWCTRGSPGFPCSGAFHPTSPHPTAEAPVWGRCPAWEDRPAGRTSLPSFTGVPVRRPVAGASHIQRRRTPSHPKVGSNPTRPRGGLATRSIPRSALREMRDARSRRPVHRVASDHPLHETRGGSPRRASPARGLPRATRPRRCVPRKTPRPTGSRPPACSPSDDARQPCPEGPAVGVTAAWSLRFGCPEGNPVAHVSSPPRLCFRRSPWCARRPESLGAGERWLPLARLALSGCLRLVAGQPWVG
jgi:hypothetical protein